jgi:type II secretory pathway pseudopilin PulG
MPAAGIHRSQHCSAASIAERVARNSSSQRGGRREEGGSRGGDRRLHGEFGRRLERGSVSRSTPELADGSGNFKSHPADARAAAHRAALLFGSPNALGPLRRSLLHGRGAFTLVEILIAVTLMSVIVLGLVAMFGQTQKAFRLGMNQTDVLESGRIATDLIVREMEQMTPSYRHPNLPVFYSGLVRESNTGQQTLPGIVDPSQVRSNIMSDIFFLTRENRTWSGIGYFVRTDANVANSFGPVGTLYRYQTNASKAQFDLIPARFWDGYNAARSSMTPLGVSKLLDGVVHFQVRAYDTNGIWINGSLTNNLSTNIMNAAFWSPWALNVADYRFGSNALPAYVELEIGILEQQTYERYKAIQNAALRGTYYTNHAGNVHLFRQRIPIRNVDLSAYQ